MQQELRSEPSEYVTPILQEAHRHEDVVAANHGVSQPTLPLSVAALGVVFGDIGTSPLYSFRESLAPGHGINPSPENVLGLVSLISWSLILIVCVKYLVFVLRADYRGEGGILALMALASQTVKQNPKLYHKILMLGLFGTALLYGDGIITPAVSVLSAMEGLELVTEAFKPYILPITCAILTGLFAVQSMGTGRVGRVFGPIMVGWFIAIAFFGVRQIVACPEVFAALNPWYGLKFFVSNGASSFWALGSVFLCVTGGEALYADMGHFGRKPIRLAWIFLVFPSLLLNYFGQGALVLIDPSAASNPFYRLVPQSMLVPIIFLATTATVIASQALISGAYSLAMQSIQMGYLPRLKVIHTSAFQAGQIYVPAINVLLLAGCLTLVLVFQTSSNLAAAYGVAVTATMVITTLLFYPLAIRGWGWSAGRALGLCGLFLIIDGSFLTANLAKIPDGGWVPLVIGFAIFAVMTTWRMGVHMVACQMKEQTIGWNDFFARVDAEKIARVPGATVFMSYSSQVAPPSLYRNLEVNRVLHETVLALNVKGLDTPYITAPSERVEVSLLRDGVYSVTVKFGFMEEIDLPFALRESAAIREIIDPDTLLYFLGCRTVVPSEHPRLKRWRERLYLFLSNNARDAGAFFKVPPERTFQIGVVVEV